jgi:hypothetical protein
VNTNGELDELVHDRIMEEMEGWPMKPPHLQYMLDGDTPVPVDLTDHEQLRRWDRFLQDIDVRRVAQTTIRSTGVWVSTVFLGCDHQFGWGPPILWETMAFNGGYGFFQNRYASAAEARAGHKLIVKHLRRRLDADGKRRRKR